MTNNTKQSEDTYIRWSVNMENEIQVGQFATEPILTIHPDGRVTTSPRLQPDEISALVLDQIKTQWLKDTQATKIRELEAELERTKQERNAIAKNTREPLLLKLDEANDRIKRLEKAGNLLKDCYILENKNWDLQTVNDWNDAKEAKP